METVLLDFKDHKGRTTGEWIYKDQVEVLGRYSTNSIFTLMGVTKTTGSMGTLGRHLRKNGQEHAFCTNHNLNLNATLALNGERIMTQ